jgi:3-hydroxyisobutyrate dehydrogenase-like beta-hydroxyacid dehydrogenase
MTRVGFVGLGSQGGPMAQRIVDAGFATTLWARRPETLEPFAGTAAQIAGSRADLGAASDVLCVCVLDDAGVDDVLSGPEGALRAMTDGATVVVHSTVRPDTCRRLQTDFPALRFVDAPVSGGGHKAAAGELLVLVGGPDDAVERCRPLFATYGDPVVHVGPLGAGQEAKLLNNALFTAQLALADEVYEIARSRGLDPQALATAVASGSGRSYASELVGGHGFGLAQMSDTAGPLLAKDVGLLGAVTERTRSPLIDTARVALDRMRSDDVWSRPGLSVRDRRFVTIACVSATASVPAMDEQVHAALASGDISVEEMNEVTLHFAVYCGWPQASQLEMSVRTQWQRIHADRGEEAPPFPVRGAEDLGRPDPADRVAHGIRCFEEINLVNAPPPDSPYFHAGILNYVFGHLWQRPDLGRRERRLVTIPCVGVSDSMGPIWSHVTSALGSGDISYDEMQEVIAQFEAYSGSARAEVLRGVAEQWRAAQA